MNWEELSAVSTFLTLIVIGATAIAAVLQLRHMRAGNALTGFIGMMDRWAGQEGRATQAYIFNGELDRQLCDPEYLKEMERQGFGDRTKHPELAYLDFWESLGMFVKLRYFPEDVVFESGGPVAIMTWQKLRPVIAAIRKTRGQTAYDSFEYLVARAMRWERRHPGGYYPSNADRLSLEPDETNAR